LSILVACIQCGQLDCHPERHVRLSFVQVADTINQLCKGLHKLVENASSQRQKVETILKDMLIVNLRFCST